MSGRQNKFRENSHAGKDKLWQRVVELYRKKVARKSTEEAETTGEQGAEEPELPRFQIPVLSIISNLLYIIVFALIAVPTVLMWIPHPHPEQSSRFAEQAAPSIEQRIQEAEAGAGAITFTEADINRYIEQHYNIIQQGGYSILAHPESIMIKVCDGYAQVIVDRMLGADFHHTITINVSFERVEDEDYSKIICRLEGGEPLIGGFARGGAVGSLPIPERFAQMMIPSLKRLLRMSPQIQELVEERGYLPHFTFDNKGQALVQFLPPSQQLLSTNN